MADTDWTAEELASIDRIPRYNPLDPANGGDAYSFGGDGYIDNQMRQTVDALIVARGARRMALSASSAAILAAQEAASAKAERIAAQNAATAAYGSAGEAAGQVTLAAAKVVLAGNEADRAKNEADRARSYAVGVKLPAVTPEMAGRFLKVNADGAAYELGLITVATATEINNGTGTGFANAQTLGPILKGMKDATAAVAAAAPEIGSYLIRPANLPSPGPNWLEAKGQIVSLASYPGLATALPAAIRQLGSQNPAGPELLATQVSSGTGTQSQILQSLFEGTRFASLQNDYVRFQDPANGKNFGRQMAPNAYGNDNSGAIPPVIRDNNEIVYILSGASQVGHIDLNTQAGLDAGVRGSNTNVEAASQHNYEGLYKLPNGTLVFVSYNNNANTGTYQRIWKLPPQSAFNGWQSFEPISGAPADVMPSYFPHFQTKSGHVYALLSASAGSRSGPVYTVYRTLDGTWQNVGTITLDRTVSTWVAGGKRREVNAKILSVIEESPDGQDIIVTLGGVGFIVTSNGGASWTFKTTDSLLGLSALGFLAPASQPNRVGYSWDAIGGQWLFSFFGQKTGGSAQQYAVTFTGSRLANLTKYQEMRLPGITSGTDGTQSFIFRTQGFLHIIFGVTSRGQNRLKVPVQSTGNFDVSPDANNLTGRVGLYLTGLLFDGVVLMESSTSSYTHWIFNDDSEQITAYDGNFQMKGFTFSVSSDGMNITMQGLYSAASQAYIYKSTAYEYNPVTERKLPNTYFQNPGGSPAVQEEYRPTRSQPKFFMRVK